MALSSILLLNYLQDVVVNNLIPNFGLVTNPYRKAVYQYSLYDLSALFSS